MCVLIWKYNVSTSLYIFLLLSFIQKGLIVDNQRHGQETQAKTDATSVIRFILDPVTSF